MAIFTGPTGGNVGQTYWDLMAQMWQDTGVMYGARNGFNPTAGSGMHINVDSGTAFVKSWIFDSSTSPVAVTITTADPTNPRIDLIVLHVDRVTPANSGIIALAGTPSVSPTAPSAHATSLIWEYPICQVLVGAGVTSFSSGNITDLRTYLNLAANPNWNVPGNVAVGGVMAAASVAAVGPITEVGSVFTTGSFGVAPIVAQAIHAAGSGTSAHTILTYAVAADGQYRVNASFRIGTSGNITVKATYTDSITGGGATTYLLANGNGIATWDVMTAKAESTGQFTAAPIVLDCKSGTNLVLSVTNSGGGGSDSFTFIVEQLA